MNHPGGLNSLCKLTACNFGERVKHSIVAIVVVTDWIGYAARK